MFLKVDHSLRKQYVMPDVRKLKKYPIVLLNGDSKVRNEYSVIVQECVSYLFWEKGIH